MELKETLPIKYHTDTHSLSKGYPTVADIEFDFFMLVVNHNKKKRRKKIQGEFLVEDFRKYYNDMPEEHKPIVLATFGEIKNRNDFEVGEVTILVTPDYLDTYIK